MFTDSDIGSKRPQIGGKEAKIEDDESATSVTTSLDAESFLDSYEEMMRHQNEEMMSSLRHLQQLLEILESKRLTTAAMNNVDNGGNKDQCTRTKIEPNAFSKEFSYGELKQVLQNIDEDENLNFMAADVQWKYVLDILSDFDSSPDEKISWAEIVMCYRTCIIGMQTLRHTPKQDELRARVRQRSVNMLKSFKAQLGNCTEQKEKQSKSSLEWFDSIFFIGTLAFLATIFLSIIKPSNTTTLQIFPVGEGPLIQGPHIPPYSTESLLIPGNILSPHFADSLMIPGPVVSPFPTIDETVHLSPSTSPIEARKAMPSSVRTSDSGIVLERKIKNPLRSRSESFTFRQPGTRTTRSNQTPISSTNKTRISKKAISVVVLAMGTTTGGYLSPIITPFMTNLGVTLSTAGLIPLGATVVASTLVAHGFRDLVAHFLARRKRMRSGENTVRAKI